MSEAGQYLIIQRPKRAGEHVLSPRTPKEFRPHPNNLRIECTVTAIVDQLVFAVLVHPEDDERKYERILPKRDDEARKMSVCVCVSM